MNAWRWSQSPSTSARRMNSSRAAAGSIRPYWTVRDCDDRQAVQRHPLGRDDGGAAAIPPRLAVGALDEVLGERLDLLDIDRRRCPAPQPRRLDELGDHHPRRAAPREHRAGEDRELRPARAGVLAGRRRPSSPGARAARRGGRRGSQAPRAGASLSVTPTSRAASSSWATRSCHSRMRR